MTGEVSSEMDAKVAYFSMEIALEPDIPTYSGGLGVLAGDTLRSAADLAVPMVAVTLIFRKGYFHQRLDSRGRQIEEPVEWILEDSFEEMPARASVAIENRTVHLRAWRYEVVGISGFQVPVYLLDSNLPENSAWDRSLTDFLYGGDLRYRLCQEVLLGIGGVRMLRSLGYESIQRFHMNEGHASLLTLELLQEEAKRGGRQVEVSDLAAVRQRCIFTTHTPVPAGHDQFPFSTVSRTLGYGENFADAFCSEMAGRVFGRRQPSASPTQHPEGEPMLNMTYLGLNLSRYVNGVAKKHGEISTLMFAGYQIDAITNGVHALTWTSKPFQELYDRYIPDWRQDNFSLRYVESMPKHQVWEAHQKAKADLLCYIKQHDIPMKPDVLTIGFARRATAYKRTDLLFKDPERLRSIALRTGGLQLVYAGKAHPLDSEGKLLIQRIFDAKATLKNEIKITYLPDYDLKLAKLLTAGVDLWLNTPRPPLEASGTSGMKAALNGIPSLSVLDGWWVEGCIEGITGWSIGGTHGSTEQTGDDMQDAASLYDSLEHKIVPAFYRDRDEYVDVMRHAIAINGSFFNTQRMLQQYVLKAYFR